jgi:hypothetical protein
VPIVAPLGILLTVARFVQFKNASLPIVVSLLSGEKVTDVRALHPANASSPMISTLAGIVIDVRFTKSSNALGQMLVTLAGISRVVTVLSV